MTDRRRPKLVTTVAPETLDAIDADLRAGEAGRGQVVDRWARERLTGSVAACVPLGKVATAALAAELSRREEAS